MISIVSVIRELFKAHFVFVFVCLFPFVCHTPFFSFLLYILFCFVLFAMFFPFMALESSSSELVTETQYASYWLHWPTATVGC